MSPKLGGKMLGNLQAISHIYRGRERSGLGQVEIEWDRFDMLHPGELPAQPASLASDHRPSLALEVRGISTRPRTDIGE